MNSLKSLLTLAMLLLGVEAAAECPPSTPLGNRAMTSNARSVESLMNSARSNCSRELSPHIAPSMVASTVPSTQNNRWSVVGSAGAAIVAGEHIRDLESETPVTRSMGQVQWVDSRDWIHNPPEWLKAVKDYRRQGMPIVHLMRSEHTLVAIGVSNHGKPGLYFTSRLPF
jgi:hypothetical protein